MTDPVAHAIQEMCFIAAQTLPVWRDVVFMALAVLVIACLLFYAEMQ